MKWMAMWFSFVSFTIGFGVGGILINSLVLNVPNTIDIAASLVTCKNHNGIAYVSNGRTYAKCKDAGVYDLVTGDEVTKYYNYVKHNEILGINFTDYRDFDYNVMK